MNLQPAVLETVALPVGATGLFFHLFMRRMLSVKRTILLDLNTFRLLFLVLGTGIIDTVTYCALKMDNLTHGLYLFPEMSQALDRD